MDRGITEERLSRLPNWASDEIRRLNREVRELRQDVEMMSGDVDKSDTNTYADPHRSLGSTGISRDDLGLPLRRDEQVRFYLDKGDRASGYIDVRVEGDRLNVHGAAGFVMTIRGSNTIYLQCKR